MELDFIGLSIIEVGMMDTASKVNPGIYIYIYIYILYSKTDCICVSSFPHISVIFTCTVLTFVRCSRGPWEWFVH